MKLRPAVLLLLGTCGCALSSGLDEDPRIRVAPEYAQLEIRGDVAMASPPAMPGEPVQNRPHISLEQLGGGDRDDAFGGKVHYGDGFAGFDLGYLRTENDSTRKETAPAGFGTVLQGNTVSTETELEAFELRYAARLFEYEILDDVLVQIGPAASVVYQELDLSVRAPATESVDATGEGIVYLGGRGRISYLWFGVEADYVVSPDLQIGGDFAGALQDASVKATFTLEDQDLTLFGGWTYTELVARGVEDGLDYDLDLIMDGFVLGLEFGF